VHIGSVLQALLMHITTLTNFTSLFSVFSGFYPV
jgi:hypothetical protein